MAATALEKIEQRFSGNAGTRTYWIKDAADVDDARTELISEAPATWEAGGVTLYLAENECEAYEIGHLWFGVARYSVSELTPGGGGGNESSFEFDTTGATFHREKSISTLAVRGTGALTTDNDGLIGVADGLNVDGVDVVSAAFAFSVTKVFDIADVDDEYLRDLFETTGTTNEDEYTVATDDGIEMTFEGGELLFLGARGGVRGTTVVITFLFAASMNDEIAVPGFDPIGKRGWEYLWFKIESKKVNNRMTRTIVAAYVEWVYPDGEFTLLGL